MRAAFPNATIFKPATLIGGEDRFTNNIAQMGKKCAPAQEPGPLQLAPAVEFFVHPGMHVSWSFWPVRSMSKPL